MGKKDNKGGDNGGSNNKGRNNAGAGGASAVVKPMNLNAVPNRDIMQRMNFLWQASVYLGGLGGVSGEEKGKGVAAEGEIQRVGRRKRRQRIKADARDLARIYVRTMKIVGQKTTVKMDPGVKRTLCRGCSTVLVPGVSARVRIRPSGVHEHWLVYTCLECGTQRRIPAPHSQDLDPPDDEEIDIDQTLPELNDQQQQQSQEGSREENKADVDKITSDPVEETKGTRVNTSFEGGKGTRAQGAKTARKTKSKKKAKEARMPPLFARRDAGHVVYRGSEVVDMEGVYCV